SDIAATFIERLLEQDPQIQVVGRARNGAELMALPQRSMAHVVLLDVLMPEVGGLSVLRQLKQCPVIAMSSVGEDSAVPMEALALGAFAFFSKRDLAREEDGRRLRETVKAAAGGAKASAVRFEPSSSVIFVVGSTGAIPQLEYLMGDLSGIAAPVLI